MTRIYSLLPLIFFLFSCTRNPHAEIPLKEHPRPDFERNAFQNLNGIWKFAPDSAMIGEKENWQLKPEMFPLEILVPFSWASPMSGITPP